jgi:hypothetical protein
LPSAQIGPTNIFPDGATDCSPSNQASTLHISLIRNIGQLSKGFCSSNCCSAFDEGAHCPAERAPT